MIVGIPRETYPGERRVALVPGLVPSLVKAGLEVLIESGAGTAAGFPDQEYTEKGAKTAATRSTVFETAEILLQVRTPGANPEAGAADIGMMRAGQTVIGMAEPLTATDQVRAMASRGVTLFAMELIPRISRAQSMDVLSSMATIAGYKAVLLAAERLPKMFPMMMTAAGTVAPAHVFVVGVGVAGLQAISAARRLGAVVHAYDIRPATKDQVLSLGAKFVEVEIETAGAEDKGGYAKAMGEEFYRRQRELLAKVVSESDVVITTAAVPGKKAPILVTGDMVGGMKPGSVIVDLAAERGGNCDLTRPGETIVEHGVQILGPLNLASTVPFHASQMYAKNLTTFLLHIVKDGKLAIGAEDPIPRDTQVVAGGEITNPQVREAYGMSSTAPAGAGQS